MRHINVKQFARPIGRRCMHCGRPATVTATRRAAGRGGLRLDVRYCAEHAALIIERSK
jgi:hypothetical protein